MTLAGIAGLAGISGAQLEHFEILGRGISGFFGPASSPRFHIHKTEASL